MKRLLAVIFSLILAVLMAVSAYAAPLNIDEDSIVVEVDGFELEAGATTSIRQLERGEEFDLDVMIKAANVVDADGNTVSGDVVKDIEINALITGFEHSRSEKISDSTRPFDLEANENVVKTLQLTLPDRADEGRYQIRIIISDRNSEPIVKNYNIKVEASDTQVIIKNFELSEEEIQAGRAVLATVRVKNLGDSQEDDVQIRVSIPDLGIAPTSDFIDDLDPEDSATSEEFFLKIDRCARPGLYEALATVTFDDGDEQVTARQTLTVTKGICDETTGQPGQTQVAGQTTVAFTETQSLTAGGSSAAYPITITNSGSTTKAFILSVDGADWADFRVSPSNLITVKAGSTQTVFVSVSAKVGTSAGERVFTVSVKDSSGNVLRNLALRADIAAAPAGAGVVGDLSGLRNALTAGLVVIVAILVVIGLILAFRRVKGGEEGESQTYY